MAVKLSHLRCSLVDLIGHYGSNLAVSIFFNLLVVSNSHAELYTPISTFMGFRSHANFLFLVNLAKCVLFKGSLVMVHVLFPARIGPATIWLLASNYTHQCLKQAREYLIVKLSITISSPGSDTLSMWSLRK